MHLQPETDSERRIIGLTGYKGSGKDTVFALLKKLEPSAVRLAFADPLKIELAAACGVTVDFINQNKDAFRGGLQWWGTEFRRNLWGTDYWTERAKTQLNALPSKVKLVVFTDVRFSNEARMLRQTGGRIWRVIRSVGRDTHQSETEMDRFQVDNHIINNGSLNQLEHFVTQVYRSDLNFATTPTGI